MDKDSQDIKRIKELDRYIDEYHTISQKSFDQLNKITEKENKFNTFLG